MCLYCYYDRSKYLPLALTRTVSDAIAVLPCLNTWAHQGQAKDCAECQPGRSCVYPAGCDTVLQMAQLKVTSENKN